MYRERNRQSRIWTLEYVKSFLNSTAQKVGKNSSKCFDLICQCELSRHPLTPGAGPARGTTHNHGYMPTSGVGGCFAMGSPIL